MVGLGLAQKFKGEMRDKNTLVGVGFVHFNMQQTRYIVFKIDGVLILTFLIMYLVFTRLRAKITYFFFIQNSSGWVQFSAAIS